MILTLILGDEEQRYILSKDPTCARDVENHCSKVPRKDNNFAVFVCLQEAVYVSFADFN